MRLIQCLALLPLLNALQLPHLPSAQEAISAAEQLLSGNGISTGHASTVLGYANDMTLASIQGDEHVTITSHRHPNHKVRIKSHDKGWCDPTAKSYSGYLDVGYGKEIYFMFFESRDKPKEDPVIMWINGGPGCSSALGAFMELGPCSIQDDPKTLNDTVFNPHSWNSHANLFFLDEPIGVGFSYAKHGQHVGTTEQAAVDVASFVQIFFDTFKEFEGRAFHMSGESYGGRYLPVFASAVWDGNAKLIKEGKTPINLKSVLIGNGITDNLKMMESYYPYQCTIHGGLNQTIQSISECIAMAEALPKCHKLYTKACIDSHDATECAIAANYCSEVLDEPFFRAGLNPYDVSKTCTIQELSTSLCYSVTDKIGHYLDLPDVRELMGTTKVPGNFTSCSASVGLDFNLHLDRTGQTWLYVANLLERGVKVLSYVGSFDWICNHIGNQAWLESLEWSGKEGFNAEKLSDWRVDHKVAGSYKSYGNLAHLKIVGAGHMVPYDKPVEALTMLTQWLGGVDFA